MSSNYVQINGRSFISLLLAVLILTLAATPALAWFDEGDTNGQPALPCRVVSDGQGGSTVHCMKSVPQFPTRVVAEQPLLHPAVARAEQISVPIPQVAEASAQ
ncbi:MAG: hypothetical protein AB1801_18820 [Chloroflexota bacterium]